MRYNDKYLSVVEIVDALLAAAIEMHASDIHIEPAEDALKIRLRIDGILQNQPSLSKKIAKQIISRLKILSRIDIAESRLPQDGNFPYKHNKSSVDLRVSTFPGIYGQKVVIRILDRDYAFLTFDQLGFDKKMYQQIKELIDKPQGLFLVTGPTGSGKTTTLYALLDYLNTEERNIITLEDPVEYHIEGITQGPVNSRIGFGFAQGMRSILRQDPDIIMVGEVRDNETAELVIHAALTGHFVLSTLHTNSSVATVPRLLDMKVEPFLLGSTLNVVIAQRLVRKICPHCKQKDKLPADILAKVEKEIEEIPEKILIERVKGFKSVKEATVYKGAGCPRCGNSGYSGRIAVVEVFDVNDKMKSIIMDGHKNLKMEDVKSSQNFVNMKQDGILKVLRGDTTIEEVLRVTEN